MDVNGKNVLAETLVAESSLLWNGSTLTIGSNNCILVPTSKHFVGKITDFNIWNRSLSQDEMNKFSLDCAEEPYDANLPFHWSSLNVSQSQPEIKSFKLNREDLCKTYETKQVLFRYRVPFDTGYEICSQLGGKMQVPANTNDLNQLLPKHINLSDYNSLRAATFWLPIKRSKKDKSKWVTLSEVNQTQVTFLLWALGQPNGELTSQDCIMSMPQRGYFDSLCEDNNWFYCTLNMTILLRLRGLQQQL